MSHHRLAGLALVAFLLAVSLPYAALISLFGYDDVLREPPDAVLAAFRAGGPALIWAWFAFAVAALAFAPVAALVDRAAGHAPGWAAPASAIAQFIGLMRWAMVVPGLAAADTEAARSTYLALHQLLGVTIGEVLGQILLVAWTIRLALRFVGHGRPILGAAGLATVPVWLLALTEPLATTLPGLPVIEAAPLAFPLWEAWLLAIAVTFLWRGQTIGVVSAISPSSPATQTSPGLRYSSAALGWLIAVPRGAPVAITSPGKNSMCFVKCARMSSIR